MFASLIVSWRAFWMTGGNSLAFAVQLERKVPYRQTKTPWLEVSPSKEIQASMFRNTFHDGLLSIFFSLDSKPLQMWGYELKVGKGVGPRQIEDTLPVGHIKRINDSDMQSMVLEMVGPNSSLTYITCPSEPEESLGIELPFLVMILKNLDKYFTFEVEILDDMNQRRIFRASNFRTSTRITPYLCTLPMRLVAKWNQVQFSVADFTAQAYGTKYVETVRIQINANCCVRRVYFCDKLYSEDELPVDYRVYLPFRRYPGK